MDEAPVGQDNIHGHDGVKSQTPCTRAQTKAPMSGMSTYANTRASAVRKSPLTLVVDTVGKIAQPHSSTHGSDFVGVKANSLKVFQIDDHAPAFSAETEGGVGMASTSGLDLDIVLASANHGVRDMLSGGGQDNDGWGVRQT